MASGRRVTLGSLLRINIRWKSGANITEPITVILDGPADRGTPARIVLRYLNGGTDGVLAVDGKSVLFAKTSTWTAENLYEGTWEMRVLKGEAATDQYDIGTLPLVVVEPPGGILPVVPI